MRPKYISNAGSGGGCPARLLNQHSVKHHLKGYSRYLVASGSELKNLIYLTPVHTIFMI